MNDAQTWTLIGGFFGLVALFGGMLLTAVKATIRAEIAMVGERIGAMGERLARVETKVDHLDRDVQAIATRWGATGGEQS